MMTIPNESGRLPGSHASTEPVSRLRPSGFDPERKDALVTGRRVPPQALLLPAVHPPLAYPQLEGDGCGGRKKPYVAAGQEISNGTTRKGCAGTVRGKGRD